MDTMTVSGAAAPAVLERVRQAYATSGLYPVLMGSPDEFAAVTANADGSAEAVFAEAGKICIARWYRERMEFEPPSDASVPWPADVEPGRLTAHLDILTHEPKPEVIIAMLPVKAPWEVFAHLRWGGWNECPTAAEHCAVHRDWGERFGAEVLSLTGDVLECRVLRPPTTRAAAMELAREQYAYCYDIVEQGVGTIEALAGALHQSRYWYFWWD